MEPGDSIFACAGILEHERGTMTFLTVRNTEDLHCGVFAAVLAISTSSIVQAQAVLVNGFRYTEQHLPVKPPASIILEIKYARDGDQLPTSKCFNP